MVIDEKEQDVILTLFKNNNPNFNFEKFKRDLNNRNIVIQDSIALDREYIRIGNIGEITYDELNKVLNQVISVMSISKM